MTKDHIVSVLQPILGGTGTGKTHLAIAIARVLIRIGAPGRFFNVFDLVNRLEARPAPAARAASPTCCRARTLSFSMSWAICPFAQSGGQLLFHLISTLYEHSSVIVATKSCLRRMAERIRRCQDHCRGAERRITFAGSTAACRHSLAPLDLRSMQAA
jgi:hypothetical protein